MAYKVFRRQEQKFYYKNKNAFFFSKHYFTIKNDLQFNKLLEDFY